MSVALVIIERRIHKSSDIRKIKDYLLPQYKLLLRVLRTF